MATRNVSQKAYEDVLKIMCKDFGRGYSQTGLPESINKAVPTGHDDLDDVLTRGAKGIYLGGVVEFCGCESSGKSSLAYRVCGNAQKMGMKCCWFDTESSFESNLAVINGCDPTKLLVPDLCDTAAVTKDKEREREEEASGVVSFLNVCEILEMIYQTIVQNVFAVVVLDSVAGLMPESTLSGTDPNKMPPGELPRAMSRFLPKIAAACKKTETTLILINQLRDKIGEIFADRFHTPGGRALKFFCQQRLGIEKVFGEAGRLHVETNGVSELYGHYARIHIIKNKKESPPEEKIKIEIPIYYREYFPDRAKQIYDLARRLKVITIRNGVLTWKDDKGEIIVQGGESAVLEKIRNEKMEARLASECVTEAKTPGNLELKIPVRVPSTLIELGATYVPGAVPVEPEEKKSKKKTVVQAL